jgi:carbon-monoxide dehydrogenase small subunit
MKIRLSVNDTERDWEVNPGDVFLDVLRDHGLTSVKRGCGQGDCGSCTILVDGQAMRSCLLLAGQMHGRHVTTVESMGTLKDPHPLQEAFVRHGAVQCGFCTPGMLLASKSLLEEVESPSQEQVREALDGNLCRCTGYVKIIDAVLDVAGGKSK